MKTLKADRLVYEALGRGGGGFYLGISAFGLEMEVMVTNSQYPTSTLIEGQVR